jgi:hypothetical protein
VTCNASLHFVTLDRHLYSSPLSRHRYWVPVLDQAIEDLARLRGGRVTGGAILAP